MNSIPHSEVNAGFLSLVELVYQNNKLLFIADKNHNKAIQEIIKLNRWEYIPSKVLPYEPKFFLLNDLILIFKIIKIFIGFRKTDTIYFLGIMPLAHIFISFFNSIFKKKIVICLHGQMEAYLKETKIGFSKYYYRLSKFIFNRNDGIDYLFFGESIKNNLLYLFNSKKNLIAIDQPYLYQELEEKVFLAGKKNFTLGFVGRFDNSKNVKEFFKFVDFLEQEILEDKIIIKIIGKVFCEIPPKYADYISYYNSTLGKDEFEKEVLQLDFVISFTDEYYYRATPSGVFFDCIKYEIPILSLNNDFTNYYLKKYNNIGEIFKNTSEMVFFVKTNLTSTDFRNNKYLTYIKNIRLMKQNLSLQNLSERFSKQL